VHWISWRIFWVLRMCSFSYNTHKMLPGTCWYGHFLNGF
jgi:hypothetical protein